MQRSNAQLSTLSIQINSNNSATGWTLLPATTTFDVASAVAQPTCNSSLVYSTFTYIDTNVTQASSAGIYPNGTYVNVTYPGAAPGPAPGPVYATSTYSFYDYDCSATPAPVAASTTVISQTAYTSPNATTGTGQIPDLAVTPAPAAVTIANSTGAFSAGTPFVYFSAYEIMSKYATTYDNGSEGCGETTKIYNMSTPFSFEYTGARVNGLLEVGTDVTGDVNPAFLDVVGVSAAIAGSWVAAPTVVVVVEKVIAAEATQAALTAPALETVTPTLPSFLTTLPATSEVGGISTTIGLSAHVESTESFLELPTSVVNQPATTATETITSIADSGSGSGPSAAVGGGSDGSDTSLTIVPFLAHVESSAVTLDIAVNPTQTIVTANFDGSTVMATALSLVQAESAAASPGLGNLASAIVSAAQPTNALQVLSEAETAPASNPTVAAIVSGLGGSNSNGGGGGEAASTAGSGSGSSGSSGISGSSGNSGTSGSSGDTGSSGSSGSSGDSGTSGSSSDTGSSGSSGSSGNTGTSGSSGSSGTSGSSGDSGSTGSGSNSGSTGSGSTGGSSSSGSGSGDGSTSNGGSSSGTGSSSSGSTSSSTGSGDGSTSNGGSSSGSGSSSGGSSDSGSGNGGTSNSNGGSDSGGNSGSSGSTDSSSGTTNGGSDSGSGSGSSGSSGVGSNGNGGSNSGSGSSSGGSSDSGSSGSGSGSSGSNAGTNGGSSSGGSSGQQPAVAPVLTLGGSTITANPTPAFVVDGQTALPGGSAITVGSDTISVLPQGRAVVVGGSTVTLAGGLTSSTVIDANGVSITANPEPAFQIGSQTLEAGGSAITVDGTQLSLAPGATAVVIDGTTSQISQQTAGGVAGAPLLTLGLEIFTGNAATQFDIGSATLTPGGVVTFSGTTISLANGGTAVVINGQTETLGVSGSSRGAPGAAANIPLITIGSQTFTANAATQFSFGPSATLTPGGVVTVSGTTISLASGASEVVINGQTEGLSAPVITPAPLVSLGGTVYSPNAGSTYDISGSLLTPGGVITVSGTTISLASDASAIVVNGKTTTLTESNGGGSQTPASNYATVTAPPVLTVDGQAYSPNGATSYIISGKTLTPGGAITITEANGAVETVSLNSAANELFSAVSGTTMTSMIGAVGAMSTGAPVLTIGGQQYSAVSYDSGSGPTYVVDGQTLTRGGDITISGTDGVETVSLDSAGTALVEVSDGHTTTSTISGAYGVMPTAAPILTIDGETFTAIGNGATYVIDGQTLVPGDIETVTISGHTFILSLAPQATMLIIEEEGPNGQVTATSYETLFPAQMTQSTVTNTLGANGSPSAGGSASTAGASSTGGVDASLQNASPSLSLQLGGFIVALGSLALAIWL
ncbi:hypothetical protein LTR85_008598 [Meristemomyces frigidus]|nr:hypothetical protein LTR85_008598 [Meristemomyces frigidus]